MMNISRTSRSRKKQKNSTAYGLDEAFAVYVFNFARLVIVKS